MVDGRKQKVRHRNVVDGVSVYSRSHAGHSKNTIYSYSPIPLVGSIAYESIPCISIVNIVNVKNNNLN